MGLDIKTLAAAKRIISNSKTDLTESSITSALGYAPVNSNKIGSSNGIATLDANGKIPTSQLPSYVSDVIEVNGIDNASKTGESDKIYVDTVTNKTYRWSGTTYVEISASDIVTSSETNGNIKVNGSEISVYIHPSGTNPHGITKDDIGLGNVPNVSTDDQTPTFTESSSRENIISGEKITNMLGKIAKWFADLKTVAFTGKTSDLINDSGYLTSSDVTPDSIGALSLDGGTLSSENGYSLDITPSGLYGSGEQNIKDFDKVESDKITCQQIFVNNTIEYYGQDIDQRYIQKAYGDQKYVKKIQGDDPESLEIQSIRLTQPGSAYGGALYFGDSEYVYFKEFDDDDLLIHTSDLYTEIEDIYMNNSLTVHASGGELLLKTPDNDSEFQIGGAETHLIINDNSGGTKETCVYATDIRHRDSNANRSWVIDNNGLSIIRHGDYDKDETIYTEFLYNQISLGNSSSYDISFYQNGRRGLIRFANITDSTNAVYGYSSTSQSWDLGYTSFKFRNIYATNGTIQTSDRNKKTNISDLNDANTIKFLMSLKPCSYKMIDGNSGRTHWGLISQDIEESMSELGMNSTDFAGFIKSPKIIMHGYDENGDPLENPYTETIEGEYDYSLRYDEFIAPIICVVQNHEERLQSLEEENDKLKGELEELKSLYKNLASKVLGTSNLENVTESL